MHACGVFVCVCVCVLRTPAVGVSTLRPLVPFIDFCGSEGRLYRTGDLSTDNLTALIGPSVNEWQDDDDTWDPNDPHDESRKSVKFREDEENDDNKEVSTCFLCNYVVYSFITHVLVSLCIIEVSSTTVLFILITIYRISCCNTISCLLDCLIIFLC